MTEKTKPQPIGSTPVDVEPCQVCDFENARLVSRAKWCCPTCGRDFSLEYLLWAEAAHPEWFKDAPGG